MNLRNSKQYLKDSDWDEWREFRDLIIKEVKDGDNIRKTLDLIRSTRKAAWDHIPDDIQDFEVGSFGEFWERAYAEFTTLEEVVGYAFNRGIRLAEDGEDN